MATCSSLVNIEDVFKESIKPVTIAEINILNVDQSLGLLTTIAKEVDQLLDVITEKGLGTYGLSKANLIGLGIIKKGLVLSDDPADLEEILNDSSVLTGKFNIYKITELLNSESLQSLLVQDIITKNLSDLEQRGLVTGDESSTDIAEIASLTTQYSLDDVENFINGIGDNLTEMLALAATATYAINLINSKLSDASQPDNGINTTSVRAPNAATDTIKTPSLDAELDKFIGSNRIASAIITDEIDTTTLTEEDIF